ncbi:hypothetical protein KIPB_007249 [Kipferlia bialata]|uniref:Association with the SNF1 complex (ASC) domain-containing protein n=1 Tax=Kipferlia bialata TaxID=797122 RepID=A0A9K3GKF7_9EUKA|nr:hypothetical protein KIPB_007249 [Kipferlia bialata]|eukprot:g7249.t1
MGPTLSKVNSRLDTSAQAGHGRTPLRIVWRHGGNSVYLTGSFINWRERIPMERDGEDWYVMRYLPPGRHQYKFIINDIWRYCPDHPTITDAIGNINNYVDVPESGGSKVTSPMTSARSSRAGSPAVREKEREREQPRHSLGCDVDRARIEKEREKMEREREKERERERETGRARRRSTHNIATEEVYASSAPPVTPTLRKRQTQMAERQERQAARERAGLAREGESTPLSPLTTNAERERVEEEERERESERERQRERDAMYEGFSNDMPTSAQLRLPLANYSKQLSRCPLNHSLDTTDESGARESESALLLPIPEHVVLTHVYRPRRRRKHTDVLVVTNRHNWQSNSKFTTTVLYRPTEESRPAHNASLVARLSRHIPDVISGTRVRGESTCSRDMLPMLPIVTEAMK